MNPGEQLIKKPVYPGGRKAMSDFLKNNLQYPKEALEQKIEGQVIVYIDIDGNGDVIRTRIKKKLGHGCDEEAIRLVKLLKFYVARKRKVRITHHKTIKIHFRLPVEKKAIKKEPEQAERTPTTSHSGMEIVYTYVPTKKN